MMFGGRAFGGVDAVFLDVYPALMQFAYGGGTQSFTVTSNEDWTVSVSQSWATVSVSSGNGDATVTVTASASGEINTRNALVTVTCQGVTKHIQVSQTGIPLTERTVNLTESGSWIPPAGCTAIDAHAVGSGSAGGVGNNYGCGGAGGFTTTIYNIPVTAGETLTAVIGEGEIFNTASWPRTPTSLSRGGTVLISANCGFSASVTPPRGGNGGSGGGGYGSGSVPGGNGGSNGENGTGANAGTGQGTPTVCPFNGLPYAGGGGGGGSTRGNGGWIGGGQAASSSANAGHGEPNTGGGGGGSYGLTRAGGNGGSGVIVLHYWSYY